MKKVLPLILAVSFLFSFAACSKTEDSNTSNSKTLGNKGYKVVDSRGKEITFDKAPEKIISLLPSDTEIIYALGDGEKLIAVSKYCNYPEDTKNKQKLDGGKKTNIEAIIGLKPDTVIMGKMAQTDDQFKQIEDAGIKVIVTQAGNIEDTYKVIEMVGMALRKETKATEIINSMKKDFEDIKNKAKNSKPKNVYIEISPLQLKLMSCGKGTFQNEILELIGANNIFSDIDGWKQVSEEQVLTRNPEVIITIVGEMYDIKDTVGEIKGRANWNKIDAVKNDNVYATDSDKLTRPGPRLAQAAKDLRKIIFGD